MRRHATTRRQDALGRVHTVNVFGAGFRADEDDRVAHFVATLSCIGVEHDHAGRGTRRGRKTLGQHVADGFRIKRRMQQLIQRRRIDAGNGFLFRDETFACHVDSHFQCSLCGTLARARLEHPELALLHREFDVLHVAIMLFQYLEHARQFCVGFGHRFFHRSSLGPCPLPRGKRQILRGTDTRDDILSLRVYQEFAVIHVLAGRGIAGESDAGGGRVAHIAEHHRLHIDRRAPVTGDVVQATIDLRAVRLPRSEHCADRAPKLIVHILRERLFPLINHDLLIFGDQRLPVVSAQFRVECVAMIFLGDFEGFLERAMIEFQHHVGIHLNEAAIAVPREPRIARCVGQPLDRFVVEAEVQHRVHHARHRHARSRTDRYEQRIGRIAEDLARHAFDMGDAVGNFDAQAVGEFLPIDIIAGAHFGGDGEARRDRQPDRGHAIQIGALATQQVLVTLAAIVHAAAEAIDIAGIARAGSVGGLVDNGSHGRPSALGNYVLSRSRIVRCNTDSFKAGVGAFCNPYRIGSPHSLAIPSHFAKYYYKSTFDAREIGNAMHRVAHPRQQCEAGGALIGIGVVHGDAFEERIDGFAQAGQCGHGGGEVFAGDGGCGARFGGI